MSASPEKIQKLRLLIGEMSGLQPKEFFRADDLPLGIPRGALVEVSGNLKTEWLIRFLRQNEKLQAFWMEKEQTILPTAIQQRGVGLDRVVFGEVSDLYPALRRVVQSQLFEVVIVPSAFEELRVLKALQLLAEKANTTVFLVAKKPQPAWPISVQLEVNASPAGDGLQVSVLKHKPAGVS